MLDTYNLIVDALATAMSALVNDLYAYSPWLGWIALLIPVLGTVTICLVLLIDIIKTAKKHF